MVQNAPDHVNVFWMEDEDGFSEPLDDLQSWARRLTEAGAFDNKDYYEILGVSNTATQREIKKAYRSQARIHHSDHNVGNQEVADENMKKLVEAYDTLRIPKDRRMYDRTLVQRSDPFESVFNNNFSHGNNFSYHSENDDSGHNFSYHANDFSHDNSEGEDRNDGNNNFPRNHSRDFNNNGLIGVRFLMLGIGFFTLFLIGWLVIKMVKGIKWILWDSWHPKEDDEEETDEEGQQEDFGRADGHQKWWTYEGQREWWPEEGQQEWWPEEGQQKPWGEEGQQEWWPEEGQQTRWAEGGQQEWLPEEGQQKRWPEEGQQKRWPEEEGY